jgi:gliding-associated putative ABC transporter substrate-binding component GldG
MNKRDFKKESIIKIAIIIGIIVVVNVIATNVFTRVDVSKNKSYTLSPVSKNLVKGLNDNMIVKAYFSENLPSPYNNIRRQVKDLLDDYRSYSNGNLNYEFLNPIAEDEANDELQQEAQKYGIQPVQVQVVNNDKMEVKRAFLGLVFLYEGKQEIIPVVQNPQTLEYDITSTIKKITSKEKKKIGFLTGHGEVDYSKLQQISSVLSSQYDVQNVDVKMNKQVPVDINAIIIMGPKTEISESEKFMLDQFIMRGGKVEWLLNKIAPNFQQQIVMGELVKTNLDDMLLSYGIKVNNDLIRDLQCSQVQVQSQIGIPISVNYPYFPQITNINRTIPSFQNIQSVVTTFVSSIDTTAAQGKNLKIEPLLTTTDKSGRASDFFILNLEQFQRLTKQAADTLFNLKGFTVGAVYTGKFNSFYQGKPQPLDTAKGSDSNKIAPLNQSSDNVKMIVIGDGDFADEANRPPKDNINFFISSVEYLMDDVGLSQIRTKEYSEAPIEETSDSSKRLIKYFNLIFPPGAVLLIGLYKWNKRKFRKKTLKSS